MGAYNVVCSDLVTVHEAIRELRHEMGLSQQAFATTLGLSISAVQKYEKDRVPAPRVLGRLGRFAQKNDLYVLAETLRASIAEMLNETPLRMPISRREQTLTDLLFIASRNSHVYAVADSLQSATVALVSSIDILLRHNEADLNDTEYHELEKLKKEVDRWGVPPSTRPGGRTKREARQGKERR